MILGLGEDGHTASLFPQSDLVRRCVAREIDEREWVAESYVEKLSAQRVTLLPNVINNSSCIAFLVCGKNKANAVAQVIEGAYAPNQYPAQLIKPLCSQKLYWYLDDDAASLLRDSR